MTLLERAAGGADRGFATREAVVVALCFSCLSIRDPGVAVSSIGQSGADP